MTKITKILFIAALIAILTLTFSWQREARRAAGNSLIVPLAAVPFPTEGMMQLVVIGDYGDAGSAEQRVAEMVKSWDPDFIITTGDNNYEIGDAATIDDNIDRYYGEYVGGEKNRFFPSLGNHDWGTLNVQAYLDYFPINESQANTHSSGNERYYDFIQGSVHFFAIDSSSLEPDGITADSVQAAWLKTQLALSTTPWQIVYFHHAPYSSGKHGSQEALQWPFAEWGVDAVLSGHDHDYERLSVAGMPYFVNGLGGRGIRRFETAVSGSQFRFNDDYGAMRIYADENNMLFEFYSIQNWQQPIDRLVVTLDK